MTGTDSFKICQSSGQRRIVTWSPKWPRVVATATACMGGRLTPQSTDGGDEGDAADGGDEAEAA